MRRARLKLFFDGGCRPNPGRMETAVVVRGVTHVETDAGHGTSNDAEWLALIHALAIAERLDADNILIVGDSLLVVDQVNGRRRCRNPAFAAHLANALALMARFAAVRIRHVGRSQNLAGIALEKRRNGC